MAAGTLTERQQIAMAVMSAPQHDEVMLFGGSRSGKTFVEVRAVILRALRAPGSRHAIARFRLNAVMASIGRVTWPAVMAACFPGVAVEWEATPKIYRFPNGSEVWLIGLDDKERIEKVLGTEFATIYLNECSQVAWEARCILMTRLSQAVDEVRIGPDGKTELRRPLKLRAFYDMNPPPKNHWTYRYFVLKVDPESRLPVPHPERIAAFRINPEHNAANLPASYMETLRNLPARLQRRFLRGEFADANPNALFPETSLDRWRMLDAELPDLQRIVIGVDPSGQDDESAEGGAHDEVGIIVGALGTDGIGYVLEDLSIAGGPTAWGACVAAAFERHDADLVVGEVNFGGGMVGFVIKASRAQGQKAIPFKKITASRGKALRAEPIAPLFDTGRVRLVGHFPKLEDELQGFSTSGYTGDRSPNRADALVFVITELFGGIVKPRRGRDSDAEERDAAERQARFAHEGHAHSWMAR